MRLINVHTRELKEFLDSSVPPYAVLSHRWRAVEDEILYSDYLEGRKKNRLGYQKIDSFCNAASDLNYDWVWVDTCCIDKSSSAELSEAINSMFSWYEASQSCLVHLEDVRDPGDLKSFDQSIWFKRGWTLQELLAPSAVTFYTKDWQIIGKKDSMKLAPRITRITGIPQRVLRSPEILHRISVARRMSWAAGRQTSRIEDIAYSLLGIFDINMPLTYGEGHKAFHRLQTHIMDQMEDESLFAWQEQLSTRESALHGLLAKSPANFVSCGNIVVAQSASKLQSPPIRMTSRGAEVFAELLETDANTGDGQPIFIYNLGCGAVIDKSAYLDVQVGGDVLRRHDFRPCSIALTRRMEREPLTRTDAGKSPSEVAALYQRVAYVRPERFYIRTSWTQEAAFTKVYDSGWDRKRPISIHGINPLKGMWPIPGRLPHHKTPQSLSTIPDSTTSTVEAPTVPLMSQRSRPRPRISHRSPPRPLGPLTPASSALFPVELFDRPLSASTVHSIPETRSIDEETTHLPTPDEKSPGATAVEVAAAAVNLLKLENEEIYFDDGSLGLQRIEGEGLHGEVFNDGAVENEEKDQQQQKNIPERKKRRKKQKRK